MLAIAVSLGLSIANGAPVTLSNDLVTATIDPRLGLTGLADAAETQPAQRVLAVSNDSWAATVADTATSALATYSPATCEWVSTTTSPLNATEAATAATLAATAATAATAVAATIRWSCATTYPTGQLPVERFVDVTYTLGRGAATGFVSKTLTLSSSRPHSATAGAFFVATVDVWAGIVLAPASPATSATTTTPTAAAAAAAAVAGEWVVQKNTYQAQFDVAAFVRFPAQGWGAFASIANPFISLTPGAAPPQPPGPDDPFDSPNCRVGTNHVGGDLPGMPIEGKTARQCEALCAASAECDHYVTIAKGCDHEPANGCYLKREGAGDNSTSDNPCTCLAAKPFAPTPAPPAPTPATPALHGSYAPGMPQGPDAPHPAAHVAEPGVLGLTSLTAYYFAGSSTGLNTGERLAFVDCVEAHHLDGPSRASKTVKVNVAWDENDYQIDVGTAAGRTDYKRIIDMNAQLGVTHVVYEPQNTLHGSLHNTTDGWGWEG